MIPVTEIFTQKFFLFFSSSSSFCWWNVWKGRGERKREKSEEKRREKKKQGNLTWCQTPPGPLKQSTAILWAAVQLGRGVDDGRWLQLSLGSYKDVSTRLGDCVYAPGFFFFFTSFSVLLLPNKSAESLSLSLRPHRWARVRIARVQQPMMFEFLLFLSTKWICRFVPLFSKASSSSSNVTANGAVWKIILQRLSSRLNEPGRHVFETLWKYVASSFIRLWENESKQ